MTDWLRVSRGLFLTVVFLLMSDPVSAVSVEQKPEPQTVVLISIDGFRHDYLEKYAPPYLNKLAQQGVRADALTPVYPSKTFPNHLSIVTGQYPVNHGIIHNKFYDRERDQIYRIGMGAKDGSWIKGTPLWTLAEQQGVKAATYFWPESDALIQGRKPSWFYPYDKQKPYHERIDQILTWLNMPKESKPRFITGYFSLVDTKGHEYGPDSPELAQAVNFVDQMIGRLMTGMEKAKINNVNLVIVSDHGMALTKTSKLITQDDLPALNRNFKVITGNPHVLIYYKGTSKKSLNKIAQRFKKIANNRFNVFTRETMPDYWHYDNSPGIPDIILETVPPYMFGRGKPHGSVNRGTHGFDPRTVQDMGGLFLASGPAFVDETRIAAFENIHIYPLIADILGLTISHHIDGKLSVLQAIRADADHGANPASENKMLKSK